MLVRVGANLMPPEELVKRLGVDSQGKVQQYLTERVRFHMGPYMPYDTGAMSERQTQVISPTSIFVGAPYARYVYEGISKSGNALNYTAAHHPKAGPHWDKAMMQNEGAQIAQEVEEYARSLT